MITCPQCGKEMQKGRLTAGGYWIRWVPEGGMDIFNCVTVSRLTLVKKGPAASICQACRKVIVDY